MNTINSNNLLDYIVCPHRLTFKNFSNDSYTISNIKSELYSKLFDYCLYLKASKQSITLHKLKQRLNYLWSEVKTKAIILPNISEKITILQKLTSIANMFRNISNVIYFDVPRTIQHKNYIILYSFYTYTQDHTVKSVIKFDRVHSNLSASSFSLRFLASIVKKDLKELNDNLRHQVYLFREDTAELYQPKIIPKKELSILTTNVFNGIENKVYYPKNEIINCKSCPWKADCSWNKTNE